MTAKQLISRFLPIALLILAAVMLFLAQSAFWINQTIFDKNTFTNLATTSVLSESSRDSIAGAVVDKALQDRPVAKRVAGQRIEALVSGLLGSDLATQAVSTLTNRTYAYTTSSDRQDIKIDLTGIKDPLEQVVELAQANGRGENLAAIHAKLPDEIVLVRNDAFPDLSGIVKLMLWLGPLFWLSTIALFGTYIYIGRRDYAKKVYFVGLTIAIVSVLGLFISPFIPPAIAAAVPNIDLRPVAQSLVTNFLAPFRAQMYHMLAYVIIALLIFNQRFNILAAVQSISRKLSGNFGKTSGK
jgi:hypothetical protein